MATRDDLIAQLQDIGLSGYEAKAYLALIAGERPLNGYEVAKRSGVPRSTVYETLSKLSARGAAFEVRENETTTYVALPPDALLRRVRFKVEESLEALGTHLAAVSQPPSSPLSYHLDGKTAVNERARDLIASAKRELYVSGWSEQFAEVEGALLVAEDLGVDITILGVDGGGPDVGRVIDRTFPGATAVLEEGAWKLLIVVQDRRNVLVAGMVDGQMSALHSDEPVLVAMIIDHLRNDIVVQTLVGHVGLATAESLVGTKPGLDQFRRGRQTSGLDRRIGR